MDKSAKRILVDCYFSDECKFNIFQSDGKCNVWRKEGTRLDEKNLSPTVKHGGGSVMVWGCMSRSGVGQLVFIDGIMDQFKYLGILKENLQISADLFQLEKYTFQQDNDPKHTSRLLKNYFIEKNITVLEWPSQSPDLNPIEHLWAYIKTRLKEKEITKKQQLIVAISEIWSSIPKSITEKLVDSMGNRVISLYKAKGGHIDY